MKLTKPQISRLAAQAETYLNAIYPENPEERRTIEDVLADIYVSRLEDKTPDQGRIMAKNLLSAVESFEKDYEQAVASGAEGCIARHQKEMEAGMDDSEACTLWMKCTAGASAAGAEITGPSAEHRELLIDLDELYVPREEASRPLADALREDAAEAIRYTGAALRNLEESAKQLRSMAQEQGEGELYAAAGNPQAYAALIAMLAYVGAKNGEYPDIPVDIRLDQMAALVCGALQRMRIAEDISRKRIYKDKGQSRMDALGSLLGSRLFTGSAMGAAAGSFFGMLLSVPAMLLTITGICVGLSVGVRSWKEKSSKRIYLETLDTEHAAQGMKEVAAQANPKFLPGLAARCRALFTGSLSRVYGDKRGTESLRTDENTRQQETEKKTAQTKKTALHTK